MDTEFPNRLITFDTPTTSQVPLRLNKRQKSDFPLSDGEESSNGNEITLNDIMKELKCNDQARKMEAIGLRNEIASLKGELTQQICDIRCSVDVMENKVGDLTTKVIGMDSRVDVVAKIANENRKMIGSYKQDKLDNFMEIDGIKKDVVNSTSDYKKLAIDVIKSFAISIEPAEIQHAFKKEITMKNSNVKTLVVVIFANINTKIRVMKEKRDIKDERTIYFNQSLTFINRNLIYKAKTIVGKKLKVYFARGNVRVLKKDNKEIIVDDESKLHDVQEYFDKIKNQQ